MKGFMPQRLHPLMSILLLIAFVAMGMLIGMFAATVALKLGFGYSLDQVAQIMQTPTDFPEGRNALLIYQGITHLFGFTLSALVLTKITSRFPENFLSPRPSVPLGLLLLSGLLIVLIMPANSWLIEWNANFKFPDFLEWFEKGAKETEERLKVLTQYLTQFDSVGAMLFGILIIAVLPAIGEELVFRGVLQQELIRWSKNHHVGIWVAGFLFGAIHMQFYGFFPRMALGVVLGYLYFWSGNIWVPILGHFMNNGFTVLMLYLQQQGAIEIDVESTDATTWPISLASLLISAAVLYFLRNTYRRLPSVPEAGNPVSDPFFRNEP
ncbi:CPBP family intramembrane glutamic endopeptidase [Rufibacter roseus]|uniref:CPBP family intramembrane glutamic endopeptidase n=1 Tax=Rufibacter roseus TaxID=1567108 RepID=A0ABW2DFR2_9BACT|nr:CPBP family intramembrane glutamic endopeptidase [Rufibacter roseus]